MSCSNKEAVIEQKLTTCYQDKFLNEEHQQSDPIEYYTEFENYLIENGYLKGRTKNDFIALWNDIYDSTKFISLEEFAAKTGPIVMFENSARSYYYLSFLMEDQKVDDDQIKESYRLIDEMERVGDLGDIELNTQLIHGIDQSRFDNIAFRIPTLTHMYLVDLEQDNFGENARPIYSIPMCLIAGF